MKLREELWEEVTAHCGKGRVAYLSSRTVVVIKGENFAK